jgi:hypothetical protein
MQSCTRVQCKLTGLLRRASRRAWRCSGVCLVRRVVLRCSLSSAVSEKHSQKQGALACLKSLELKTAFLQGRCMQFDPRLAEISLDAYMLCASELSHRKRVHMYLLSDGRPHPRWSWSLSCRRFRRPAQRTPEQSRKHSSRVRVSS